MSKMNFWTSDNNVPYFGQLVERDPEEQLVREVLQDAEERIHAPVHEPLGVIVLMRGLNGLDPIYQKEN